MPRRENPNQKEAQTWLSRAESNLALAKIDKPTQAYWEDLCYNAQQAAEKALKAVCLYYGIRFRFIHDLQEIITDLQNHKVNVPTDVTEVVKLTPYAVEARYPGCSEPVTRQEYEQAVMLAEKTVVWAKTTIG